MRLRGFLVSAVLAIMVAWIAVPVQAQASAETITFHNEVMSFPVGPLPCPGGPGAGTVTVTLNGVMHFSVSAEGTSNFQFTGTGTFVFKPDDPTDLSAEGRVTQWFGGQVKLVDGVEVPIEFTSTVHITAIASDGSIFHVQITAHTTFVGGEVVVAFMKFVCA